MNQFQLSVQPRRPHTNGKVGLVTEVSWDTAHISGPDQGSTLNLKILKENELGNNFQVEKVFMVMSFF